MFVIFFSRARDITVPLSLPLSLSYIFLYYSYSIYYSVSLIRAREIVLQKQRWHSMASIFQSFFDIPR